MSTILAIILYILYLMVMTVALLAIGFVTICIGTARGLVKGISYTLEIYFGTLIEELGER